MSDLEDAAQAAVRAVRALRQRLDEAKGACDRSLERVTRLRELGAQGYISKPCQPEMIRLKVQQILGDEHGAL